jgi:hypothetical protein
VWESVLECIIDDPDYGSSPCIGNSWRQPGHGTNKRELNTKIHLAVDAHGMQVRMFITADTVAECTQGYTLIVGIHAEWLLGDKVYDSNEIIAKAQKQNM